VNSLLVKDRSLCVGGKGKGGESWLWGANGNESVSNAGLEKNLDEKGI